MTWRTYPPSGRVWALVLRPHESVPRVAQYEPAMRAWCDGCLSWSICEWHPLPRHERFNERTHAVDASERAIEELCEVAESVCCGHDEWRRLERAIEKVREVRGG